MNNKISFENINGFSVDINKLTVTHNSPLRHSAPHIHDVCEIYINISGNVSFMVEKCVYPISHGDIIITKPYEYHHCIYNDDSDHEHYWIMFPVNQNKNIFTTFLERKNGQNNLIRLPKDENKVLFESCNILLKQNTKNSIFSVASFFELLSIIENGSHSHSIAYTNKILPADLVDILDYMSENFSSISTINDVANSFHISINTMERYFKQYLSISPKRYLEDKKLSNACILLRQNASVTTACFESGFKDYSHFIASFKKKFNITPLKYRNITSFK